MSSATSAALAKPEALDDNERTSPGLQSEQKRRDWYQGRFGKYVEATGGAEQNPLAAPIFNTMQQEQQAEQKAEQPTEQRPNVAKPFNPPAWLVKEARDRAMAASDTDKKVKYPYVMKPLNPSAWVVKEARAASNTDEEVQRPYVVKPFNPPAWVVKEARDNAARLGIDPAAVARIVKSNTSPFIITKPTKVDQESNRAISRQAVVALPETNLHTNSTDQTKSLLTRGPESTQ